MKIDRDKPFFSRNIEMDISFLKVIQHELASGKVAGCAPVTDSPGVIALYELAKQFQQIVFIGPREWSQIFFLPICPVLRQKRGCIGRRLSQISVRYPLVN